LNAAHGPVAGAPVDPRVAAEVAAWLDARRPEMLRLLEELVRIETPSRESGAHAPIFAVLRRELEALGLQVRQLAGRESAGCLLARPRERRRGIAPQLLVGHVDTVWPRETLARMPAERHGDELRGPGVYDMKGGLVQLCFALAALAALRLVPPLEPVVLLNSDEEIGSHESTRHIRRLARIARRALVLEPSLGLEGRLKTSRKGVGRFEVTVHGRAAHAGLDPQAGVSAILELSHVIQSLFALNDVEHGISVNVGTIDGGLGANVIAPSSRAVVDVRVPTRGDAERIEQAIRALRPTTPGTRLEIAGGMGRPPMEPDAGSRALWRTARALALQLGIALEEAAAGGASDGNTTSAFTPTLDGLGAVGDGAHAAHEAVRVDKLPERAALLALILLAPAGAGQSEASA